MRTFADLPIGAYFVPITGRGTQPATLLVKIADLPVEPGSTRAWNSRQIANTRHLAYCPASMYVVEIEMPGPDAWLLEIRPCEADEKQKQMEGRKVRQSREE